MDATGGERGRTTDGMTDAEDGIGLGSELYKAGIRIGYPGRGLGRLSEDTVRRLALELGLELGQTGQADTQADAGLAAPPEKKEDCEA